MQNIEWRTRSPEELADWSSTRHYQAEFVYASNACSRLNYYCRAISDNSATLAIGKCTGVMHIRRGWEHIRRNTVETFTVYYPLRGQLDFVQNGTSETVSLGELVVLSSEMPLRIGSTCGEKNPIELLHLKVPAYMFRSFVPDADRICGRKIPIGAGLGGIVRNLLVQTVSAAPEDDLTERLFGKSVEFGLEAVRESIRVHMGDSITSNDLRQAHLERLLAYIDRNLGCKTLTVDKVAKANGISKRYVHAIMEQTGSSFSQYVWSKRLEQAKTWLQSTDHRHLAIEQVAALAGFTSPSHFSCTFKARFGVSPSATRKQAVH